MGRFRSKKGSIFFIFWTVFQPNWHCGQRNTCHTRRFSAEVTYVTILSTLEHVVTLIRAYHICFVALAKENSVVHAIFDLFGVFRLAPPPFSARSRAHESYTSWRCRRIIFGSPTYHADARRAHSPRRRPRVKRGFRFWTRRFGSGNGPKSSISGPPVAQ